VNRNVVSNRRLGAGSRFRAPPVHGLRHVTSAINRIRQSSDVPMDG
jgi:hypothetical protein